jgi:Gamma-glutamyl cyclotransferase, AIG2-like
MSRPFSLSKNMTFEDNHMENLFSYGTLQTEAVQLATFYRRLKGKPDTLAGYRLIMIRIEDEDFVTKSGAADHRNLQFTGNASDYVEGMAFSVTVKELEQADAYEPDGYERVSVKLKSGLDAWIYLNRR